MGNYRDSYAMIFHDLYLTGELSHVGFAFCCYCQKVMHRVVLKVRNYKSQGDLVLDRDKTQIVSSEFNSHQITVSDFMKLGMVSYNITGS